MTITCDACTAVYSVGARRCPQCGSTDHHLTGETEDTTMPKITKHEGASYALPAEDIETRAEESRIVGEHGPEVVPGISGDTTVVPVHGEDDPVDLSEIYEQEQEGGEESSPGSSSETSSAKPETSSEQKAGARPKRARTTANPSRGDRTGNSSAASTDGDQTGRTSRL